MSFHAPGPSAQIAVLIATRNRDELLATRSLPSIRAQTLRPSAVVVVNDGLPHREPAHQALEALENVTEVVALRNRRARGVAGAWNTGLEELWTRGFRGFVALLDDDDEWDRAHLQANAEAAAESGANVVVTGLRMCSGGIEERRPLIEALRDRDYLVGNPGWQGSNTFVSLPLLVEVGGFREGLPSLHDRDLAIRLLRHPSVRPTLIPRWTATWNRDTPGNLSGRGSPAKLAGLRAFWSFYGSEMTDEESVVFFDRAAHLFGFEKAIIVRGTPVAADQGRGDLHVAA